MWRFLSEGWLVHLVYCGSREGVFEGCNLPFGSVLG